MKIFKEFLIKESNKTGFRPEILEKVWQLMNVLEGIHAHPYLQERLVLKGGTALNLFVFDLPRLSVDIDLNDDWILYDDTGLKGFAAEWAKKS